MFATLDGEHTGNIELTSSFQKSERSMVAIVADRNQKNILGQSKKKNSNNQS